MLSNPYYAKTYAGIIYTGLYALIAGKYVHGGVAYVLLSIFVTVQVKVSLVRSRPLIVSPVNCHQLCHP